jgi:hypothetical protein
MSAFGGKADMPATLALKRLLFGSVSTPWFGFDTSFSFIPRAVGHTSKLRLTFQGRDRLPL